ncbi:MAG TPA: response regulator [Pyrinomonadaceae bacterium]|jgi:CheY-like chemotaxis protein
MQVPLAPLPVELWIPSFHLSDSSHFSSSGKDLPDDGVAAMMSMPREGKVRPSALVVDDAPDVTEMIAMFLEHAGYHVVMAFSAPEALEAARGEQFEVIVSDIGMPGMNGYDLAIALRGLPEYGSVPMVAVTGFSQYDDRGRALASGFNAHLTKPINPMELLDLIKKLRDEDHG